MLQYLRAGASNQVVKTLLFGLLMLATLGLMLTGGFNFNNLGGVGRNDVVRIGGDRISLQSFDSTLRRALARLGIPPQQAYKMGYVNEILAQEIRERLVARAALDNGLRVDRARVARKVREMIKPMLHPGQTEDDVLKTALMSQGVTEAEFVDGIQREMDGNLMAGLTAAGFAALPDVLLKDLYAQAHEKRDVSYIAFLAKDATPPAKPSDDDLKKLYELGKEEFAVPETRVLTLVKIKTDDLAKTIAVTDEEVKSHYDSNLDAYTATAGHTLEQALLNDEAEAKKIYDLAKNGKTLEDAAKETKNISAYLGVQDFADKEIDADIKDPVLKARQGDLLAPVKSALGWRVILVKKVTEPGVQPFEKVKDEIKKDLTENKLMDARFDRAQQVDDALASGASLDDVKKNSFVEIAALPPVNSFGQDESGKDALKSYDKDAHNILESGFKLNAGEAAPAAEMANGDFVAVRADTINPKSWKPFEKAKETLTARWMTDQARAENRARATAQFEKMKAGGKSLKDYAVANGMTAQTVKDLTASGDAPAPFNKTSVETVFSEKTGAPALIDIDGGLAIAVTDAAHWPEKIDAKDEDFKKFRDKTRDDMRNEAFTAYIEYLNTKYKAETNDALLEQAYGGSKTQDAAQP